MSDSCGCPPEAGADGCDLRPAPPGAPCPTNGQTGKRVDALTLKALAAVPLTEVTRADYWFCPAPDCPTVYYSADGSQCFGEDQLRERVFQKHRGEDKVWVCYCFRHTPGGIKGELAATHTTTVVAAIHAGIQAGQCACEIRNPQGSCCLGNVRALVRELSAHLG